MTNNRYAFSWNLLGDVSARENLGPFTRVEIYRLMQFSIRDVLERHLGGEKADAFFREAGEIAGKQFFDQFLNRDEDFTTFTASLQAVLKELGIGILRFEKVDLENSSFVMTVGEDLDCSGLPELDYEFCAYDEGFLAGILNRRFPDQTFVVREIDCWCTGARTCRFTADLAEQ